MGTNCINGIPTASYMPHTQVIRQSGRGLCWGATRRGIAGATHCDANGPVCVNTSTHSLPLLPLCILLSSIAVDCPCLENPIARHTQSCRRTDPQQSNHRKTRAQHHQKPRSRSLGTCRVGEDVTTLTPHRTGCADFPHNMWRATYYALCGVGIYVACCSVGAFQRRELTVERHIISRL